MKLLYLLCTMLFFLLLASCANAVTVADDASEEEYEILNDLELSSANDIPYEEYEILDYPELSPEELTKETSNFVIHYYSGGASAAASVAHVLEENFEWITTSLETVPRRKTQVFIYPSLLDFQTANGFLGWDWFVGMAARREIRITSPNCPGPIMDYNGILVVAVHEFVHVVQIELNPSIVWYRYLLEGTAMYMAGVYMPEHEGFLRDWVVWGIDYDQLPSAQMLLSRTGSWDADIYWHGMAFVEYVVYEFGYEGLVALHRDPNFQRALGICPDEFYENWLEFLNDRYVNINE